MSAFAACMNMTTRGLLNERNASYEEVVTKVELDRSDLDHLTFFYQTEIIGDVPEEIRQQVLREAENCDVCRMLRAEKTFLPLDALNKYRRNRPRGPLCPRGRFPYSRLS